MFYQQVIAIHINIRSLPKNFDKLNILLGQLLEIQIIPDAILLCETFLTETNKNLYNIENYSFVGINRIHHKGGGVGMYIRNIYNFKLRNDLNIYRESNFEYIVAEISFHKTKLYIAEIYHIPGTNVLESLH